MDALRLPVGIESLPPAAAERPAAVLLAAWWRIVLKHKWGILGLALALGLLGMLIAHSLEPVWQARATLLADTRKSSLSPVGNDMASGWASYFNRQSWLQTQILLIQSRALATAVADKLNLWEEPGLDPRQAPPRQARFQFEPGRFLPWGKSQEPPPMSAEQAREAVIGRLQAGIGAEVVPESDFIAITFDAASPELAAKVANAYAEGFLEFGLETRLEQVRRAANWLTDRLEGVRRQLEQSEQSLQEYREREGLVATDGGLDLTEQGLTAMSERLMEARAERDRLDALLREAGGLGSASHPTVAGNPVVQALKSEELAAERQVQELSKRYGDQHPRMVAVREDLRTVRARLGAEIESVLSSLRKERDLARSRAAQLERELAGIKSNAQTLNRKEFTLRALEREVEANRQLYDLFLNRFKETDLGTDLESTDARIIDPARPPTAPIKPRKGPIVAVTVILALLLGIALAFLLEQLDNTLQSGEDVEESLRLAMLGTLPLLRPRQHRGAPLEQLLLTRPKSEFAEAVRTIRTGLMLSGVDQPPKRVLITSTVPGEGKSTLAASLAMALGQLERVLLIDADLRRATLHTRFALAEGAPGLSDLVTGNAGADACIHRHEASGIHLLPAGTLPPNPLELLSSQRFARTLAELSERFDRILIDSAPAQAVSDALVLSQQVDAVLYVVKADATPLPVVEIAIKRLRQVNAPLTGVVLNQFDNARSARYGHYQYGRYRRYSYAYGGYSEYEGKGSPPTRRG